MNVWKMDNWKADNDTKNRETGVFLRFDRDVDPDVRSAIKNFHQWVTQNYSFPIKVTVYLRSPETIKAMDGEMVSATFFGPYNRAENPYIRIAVGDYCDLLKRQERDDALASIIFSFAHELTHYFQWLNKLELFESEEEKQAVKCADYILRAYSKTREHPVGESKGPAGNIPRGEYKYPENRADFKRTQGEKMGKDNLMKLEDALQNSGYLTIKRAIKDGSIDCIPIAMSCELLLVLNIWDFHLDGYKVINKKDITKIQYGRVEKFFKHIIKSEYPELPRCEAGLSAKTNWKDLLGCFKDNEKVVIIENENEDLFLLGKVVHLEETAAQIKCFDAMGKWDKELCDIEYSEITCVTFGDKYSEMMIKYALK